MKIVRVDSQVDDIAYGAVEPEGIRLHRGSPFVAWEPTETVIGWQEARLLAPVIPTKIVAIGKNYVEHAAEMESEVPDRPLIFLKPPTSVIGGTSLVTTGRPTACASMNGSPKPSQVEANTSRSQIR